MAIEDVTTGELFRAVGKVEKAVDDGFKAVNERIDHLRHEFVTREVYDIQIATLAKAVGEAVTSRRYWITTAVAVLAASLALVTALRS